MPGLEVNILLGVTGGIAAYKAVDLAGKLAAAGAAVNTVMTENACQLISPKSFEAVTHQPVFTGLWTAPRDYRISHIELTAAADIVVIAGEAESHCVLETVEDLVEDFGAKPDALQKIYFLRDCTSPVVHPDIDFHAIAMKQFAQFERQGVNFIDSTDKLPF